MVNSTTAKRMLLWMVPVLELCLLFSISFKLICMRLSC